MTLLYHDPKPQRQSPASGQFPWAGSPDGRRAPFSPCIVPCVSAVSVAESVMTEVTAEVVVIPLSRWRRTLGVFPAWQEEEDHGETHTREWRMIPKDQVQWGHHRFAHV